MKIIACLHTLHLDRLSTAACTHDTHAERERAKSHLPRLAHLRHQPDLPPHPRHVERPNVHAVQKHRSRLGVVEPQEEVDHGRPVVDGRAHLFIVARDVIGRFR